MGNLFSPAVLKKGSELEIACHALREELDLKQVTGSVWEGVMHSARSHAAHTPTGHIRISWYSWRFRSTRSEAWTGRPLSRDSTRYFSPRPQPNLGLMFVCVYLTCHERVLRAVTFWALRFGVSRYQDQEAHE